MTRVGVVVPAYRPDLDRLGRYVRSLDAELEPATIRIELDAPESGVREALAELPATVNAVPYRRGKGAAITAGFEALSTDVRAFADADGSTPAESVADVLAPLTDGRADLAVGSRRHPEARVRSHQTRLRRRMGDGFAWLARRLLDADLYDFQCGAKGVTDDAWTAVRDHLYEPGFAWDIELIAITAALGYRIAEVPITWEDAPDSTVSTLATPVSMAQGLFRARHRARILQDSRLHSAIDRTGTERALIDREPDPDPDHGD
jgi:hypothetical protein